MGWMTKEIADITELQGSKRLVPLGALGQGTILAEVEARVTVQIGTNKGHDRYLLIKTRGGWLLCDYGDTVEFARPSSVKSQ
jgi:hypothetical protein